jgi:hypothetical protein
VCHHKLTAIKLSAPQNFKKKQSLTQCPCDVGEKFNFECVTVAIPGHKFNFALMMRNPMRSKFNEFWKRDVDC